MRDFWVEDLALILGTNQLVAALRDQAGNTDYTTNTVYLSAASTNLQYAYNTAGCMTNLNGIALGWDERYRLKSVQSAQSVDVSYEYDVLNRRTSRSSIAGGITTVEHYIYNGNQITADLDGSGTLLRIYVWGTGIDNLLSFTDHITSNTYYAIKDHQNSVVELVDESGFVVESYEYDAYGNTRVFDASGSETLSSASGNRYAFQGREIDWETGLYYFRARWYDPETGRWLSKDPLGISGGLNQYVFVENTPVNSIDPSGLTDLNLASPNDPMFLYGEMAANNPFDNTFSISAHGDEFGNIYGPDGLPISTSDLVDMIQNNPNYSPGMDIFMIVCFGDISAQEIADMLGGGTKVLAATDVVYGIGMNTDGEWVITCGE